MRHRLSGISTYGLNDLGKGDEHPAYGIFTFYLYAIKMSLMLIYIQNDRTKALLLEISYNLHYLSTNRRKIQKYIHRHLRRYQLNIRVLFKTRSPCVTSTT